MTDTQVSEIVKSQIGVAGETTNLHGVNLRKALVPPQEITVIDRQVLKGKIRDRLQRVWLVLVENPDSGTGYRIVADHEGTTFGLASEGFPNDKHLVLCGWYGDFMTTFQGM